MVSHLHDAGIEVILDVVYNHTAEGNELGPTLSFKGIDNASYYRLAPDNALLHQRHRHRQHGQSQPSARAADGDGLPALLGAGDACRRLPLRPRDHPRRASRTASTRAAASSTPAGRTRLLSQVKLIAEPWDCGPGGYQVGRFSPGWAEWNDRYRDTVRAYWKGDEGKLPELAARLTGSADIFNKRGRRPWASRELHHRP